MNARFVLQAVLRSDIDLGGEAVAAGVDGRAHDRGEAGVDQRLSADDDEDP